MEWQACVNYRLSPTDHVREAAFRFEAPDEVRARAYVEAQRTQAVRYRTDTWEIVVLEPIPTDHFIYGQMTDQGFVYECGCRMEPSGKLIRCQAHDKKDGVSDEAIVEAVTALGLLKERRQEYTCESCGGKTKGQPTIGDYAGRFTFPRGWEREEWSRRLAQETTDGRLYEHGTATFCSRRCRGQWLIATADTHRKS